MNGGRWFSLFFLVVGCQKHVAPEAEPALRVRCVAPKIGAISESIELLGQLEPPPGGDLPLASQVAGRIVEVNVREGQRVESGQVIASVDDVASRDAVRQAEASFAQANAAELNASRTLERTRALVARGIAARQELDDAQAKAEAEKQNVSSSHAALDLARRTLGRVQVRAAFGGVVTRVFRGPGAIVDASAATPIAELALDVSAEFVADALETDLARIHAGETAKLRFDALGEALAAKVTSVASSLDPLSGLGKVRLSVANPPKNLAIGAHGSALVSLDPREGARLLPLSALRGAVADGAEVVVCDAGAARVRSVRVGYRDATSFEILSGVGANERVAIDHVLGLEDATRLTEVE